MSTDKELRGIEMNEEEIDEALKEFGFGTLSMANKNDAYGIPVSFGYDGDRIVMYLIQFGDDSQKLEYIEQTEIASLTSYKVTSKTDWRSIVVQGELSEIIDEDEIELMESVMDDNSWHPAIFPPTEPMTDVKRFELRIDEVSGRKGEAYQ